MRELPILFSGPMVRAILDGRKSVTRRAIDSRLYVEITENGMPVGMVGQSDPEFGAAAMRHVRCPYGQPGDRLWVRETWAAGACADLLKPSELSPAFWRRENGGLWYRADGREPVNHISPRGRWRPSIHMPRWASRITLEVLDVRVERLQEITEEEAIAEGVTMIGPAALTNRTSFARLWDSLNARRAPWSENPWVWVVAFRRLYL